MYSLETLKQSIEGCLSIIEREDGTFLHCIVKGEGAQDIVLVHGYGVSSQEWNILASLLEDAKYRLIIFDQRGHGESTIGSEGISSVSMASDLKAVLEHFNVRNAVLGGHSMGGFLVQKFFLTYPDVVEQRLKACLLIATFAGNINRFRVVNTIQQVFINAGILSVMVMLTRIKVIARAFTRSMVGEHYQDEMATVFIESFQAQNHRALAPILSAFGNEDYSSQLHRITLPCTIIIGTSDATTPMLHSEKMHANIPHSRLIKVPGAGHALNWEAPELLLAEIEAITYS